MSSDETTPLLNAVDNKVEKNVATYPPARKDKSRTLILLFDGTGDYEDDDISNVVALKRMLHPIYDEEKQMIFYQTGVGTYHPSFPGLKNVPIPLVKTVSRTVDSAVAWSLDSHVIEAYQWVIDHYDSDTNDRICMFGFSRGAYTARAVSGMINKIGLLPKPLKDKAQKAYECYEKKGKNYGDDLKAFRDENQSRDVPIEFLGVWDTVSSVGIVAGRTLPFANRNGSVKTFRHAIALDEHRARFAQDMWRLPKTKPSTKKPWDWSTDVDQVWFAGAHCDVGGGSVKNAIRPNLAHISLRWMIRECFKAKNGMMFDINALKKIGLDPDMLYPEVEDRPHALEPASDMQLSFQNVLKLADNDTIPSSGDTTKQPNVLVRFGSWVKSIFVSPAKEQKPAAKSIYDRYNEEQLDLVDALAPIFDQLSLKKFKWALLEAVPMKVRGYSANFGRGRAIPLPVNPALETVVTKSSVDPRWTKIRVHRTVKTRMVCKASQEGGQYVPKALLNGETSFDKIDPALIEWVD